MIIKMLLQNITWETIKTEISYLANQPFYLRHMHVEFDQLVENVCVHSTKLRKLDLQYTLHVNIHYSMVTTLLPQETNKIAYL